MPPSTTSLIGSAVRGFTFVLAALALPRAAQGQRLLGSAEERARIAQAAGTVATDGFLLRSWSSRVAEQGWLGIETHLAFNSALPYSLNDGALWAGRGANLLLRSGWAWRKGRLGVLLAPEFTWSQNRAFVMPDSMAPPVRPDRSPWSSPWHPFNESADLPIRFGPAGFAQLHPGQSSARLDLGPVAFTAATENHWWGPGTRNALLLSNNAPGFPHLSLRSARPWATPLGDFEWAWLSGVLTESQWFDTVSTNNHRTIAAFAATWRLKWEPGLTLGIARSVYAPAGRWTDGAGAWFDAFRDVGRPNAHPWYDYAIVYVAPDQIASVFGRWVIPPAGAEVYGEWAWSQQPRGLRGLLTDPDLGRGYTLGARVSRPLSAARQLLVSAEMSNVEKSSALRGHVGSFYASRAVSQGYSERGQVLGAAIGPGASSQFLAADVIGETSRVGGFLGRVRWEEDALHQLSQNGARFNRWCSHDVSVLAGVRGARERRGGTIEGEFTLAKRYNVHSRNASLCPRNAFPDDHTDRLNLTLAIRWSPELRSRPSIP